MAIHVETAPVLPLVVSIAHPDDLSGRSVRTIHPDDVSGQSVRTPLDSPLVPVFPPFFHFHHHYRSITDPTSRPDEHKFRTDFNPPQRSYRLSSMRKLSTFSYADSFLSAVFAGMYSFFPALFYKLGNSFSLFEDGYVPEDPDDDAEEPNNNDGLDVFALSPSAFDADNRKLFVASFVHLFWTLFDRLWNI
jgi:hypothetical protein